jgi:CO/xanthine dehydrogenase FAD-binding subunit
VTIAYHQPRTLEDATALLAANPKLCILAGATDVYPAKTARAGWGHTSHADVLDISRVPGLRGIRETATAWEIGALTTWTDILRAGLPPLFDGLKAAAREIGGIQIQNRGTIAGNICTASPAGDSIPCLMALDAEIELVGVRPDGLTPSIVPIWQFFTGYRRTFVSGGAGLVTAIRIPKQPGRGHFLKLGARRYLVISIAMAAGVFDIDDQGLVRGAKIAVGACSAVAQRLPALEAELTGRRLGPDLVRTEHLAILSPIDDARGSAGYRRAAALQLVRDLVAQAGHDRRRAA